MVDHNMAEGISYLPENMEVLTFEKFDGLNTKASRNGIEDTQMYWCDGWMPLGHNNLRTLPDVGTILFTASGSLTVFWYEFGNIGVKPYCIAVLSDGSIVAIRTDLVNTSTIIAPAGTITAGVISLGTGQLGLTQWGSSYIIIVAGQTNGFFVWDGTNFFQTGTIGPDVEMFQSGEGYSSQPTITTIGGSGTGATFLATIFNGNITGITVTNPGSGFSPTDEVILAFTGGGSAGTTANLQPVVNAGGTITSVNIVSGGAAYGTPTGTVLDDFGVGATLSITQSGGVINHVTVVNGGNSYSTKAQILIEDPGFPGAVATVDLMPSGVSGTCAETYTARLFIGDGPLMQISAPGSIVDFAASDGGDLFNSTDSFLKVAWTALQQSNGFIYLVADSSVNYISGIQTSGSPPSTTFTNQNADPENGTPWEPTAGTFGESVIFANQIGIQLGYGGRFTKISDQLDGFYFTGVNDTTAFVPSAAKAIIFGRKVWMMLYNIDTLMAPSQNKLLMTDGKLWWTSSQGVKLIYIAGQEINSVLTAWGTDGKSIYPLFQNPSTNFKKTVQSKLWDKPGGYTSKKTSDRIWGAAQWNNLTNISGLNFAVDSDTSGFFSPTVNFQPPAGFGGIYIFPPTAISNWGALLGITIITNDADVTLISANISASIDRYAG